MSSTLTIRLTKEEAKWLKETARRLGKTRSAVLHDQLRLARSPQRFQHLIGAIEGGPDDVSERRGFASE